MNAVTYLLSLSVILSQTNCEKEESFDAAEATKQLANTLGSTLQMYMTEELGANRAAQVQGNWAYGEAEPEVIAERLANKLVSAEESLLRLRVGTSSRVRPCPFVRAGAEDEPPDVAHKRTYFLAHSDFATAECEAAHPALRAIYHAALQPYPKMVVLLIGDFTTQSSLYQAVAIATVIVELLRPQDRFALKISNMSDFVSFESSCGTNIVFEANDLYKIALREYLTDIETKTSNTSWNIDTDFNIFNMNGVPEHRLVVLLTESIVEAHTKINLISNVSRAEFAIVLIQDKNDANGSYSLINLSQVVKYNNTTVDQYTISKWHLNGSTPEYIGQIASAALSLLPRAQPHHQAYLLHPVWEATENDFVIPMVMALHDGLLGIDLFWSDLAQDIIYFEDASPQRRLMVLDQSGIAVMHSHFPRPGQTSGKIRFTNLETIERSSLIIEFKNDILMKEMGEIERMDDEVNKLVRFKWHRAGRLLTVLEISEGDNSTEESSAAESAPALPDLLLHRLDMFAPLDLRLCRHFRQLATTDRSTVFLAPGAFRSPFAYARDVDETYLRNCVAYMRAVAGGLLANPGLRRGVRSRVATLLSLAEHFERSSRGERASLVIRRYVVSGPVLVAHPGGVLPHEYEPSRRAFYTDAIARRGRVQLQPPNLDPAGAGYAVTISLAPTPRFVLALDAPAALLQRWMREASLACASPSVRCMIINAKGYLVAHPSLPAPPAGPSERLHVTHLEAAVAADALSRQGLLKKALCEDAATGAVQRRFSLNTSMEAFGGMAGGERYFVAPLPLADAFVAMVLAGRNGGAFCPCSTIDRLCLNCDRVERTECECPCECPARHKCGDTIDPKPPLCPPPAETDDLRPTYFARSTDTLEPCFDLKCSSRSTLDECAGTVGCEWCRRGADGAPLSSAYCGAASACWDGVEAALTPYGGAASVGGEAKVALGPLAGAAAVALALLLYRYRRGGAPPAAIEWSPASGAESTAANEGVGRERLLSVSGAAAVSPYASGGGVRARCAGSDHGYSTMTPLEDSEPPPSSASDVSCSRKPPPRLTCASLLAPVTVHRHMEQC